MVRVISLLIGYAFGLFQTSYFYGKKEGIDIRKEGSGNAGTTNALRTMGLKAGLVTMGCDIGKCILAVIVTWLIFRRSYPDMVPLIKIWTSAGVILGHDFPFYLKFKGGKGIAATAGMIIAFGDLRLIGIGILVFFSFFFCYPLCIPRFPLPLAGISVRSDYSRTDGAVWNDLGASGGDVYHRRRTHGAGLLRAPGKYFPPDSRE
jgi:acyl-phosphate glycerol 3-phosphate acyltransferase